MDSRTGYSSPESYEQLPAQRSPAAVKMDNLIRRTLGVSNPYDPREVAERLTRYYPGARRLLEMEEAGLPFFQVQAVEVKARNGNGATSTELEQARSDIVLDFTSLLQNALLKDVHPELRGWQSAIEAIVEDATAAAGFGLDPRQRDKTFAARRLLGDYARVARFLGALTPNLNSDYRGFAQSLDEISSVLLVMMGESLAKVGFGGGRFLLQAPASELQTRREAVLNALRHLLGLVSADAQTQDEWPRAMHSYRLLLKRLDDSGHSDLRALFEESTLARLMDELIARAATPGRDSLRALGSTAALNIQRLRRLLQIGQRLVDPDSPPLKYFFVALQLFFEAFNGSTSGFRVLFLARPPIVFYGLYGIGGPDEGTRRLLELVTHRGELARLLDCYLGCDCQFARVQWQIIFDKLLYDLDRAIDYYALGTNPLGQGGPEIRAEAFGILIQELNELSSTETPLPVPPDFSFVENNLLEEERKAHTDQEKALLQVEIEKVRATLTIMVTAVRQDQLHDRVTKELKRIRTLLISAVPEVIVPPLPPNLPPTEDDNPDPVTLKQLLDKADPMFQELCMQEDSEEQWVNLLQAMAPSCHDANALQALTQGLLAAARVRYFGRFQCPPVEATIPPTVATTFAGPVFGEFSEGGRGA